MGGELRARVERLPLARAQRLLIENGANLEALDKSKETPIFFAAACGRMDCVELLVDSGADERSSGFSDR